MATIINDRDVLLQATVPRFTVAPANKALVIGSSTPVFHIDTAGANSPASITFTAQAINIVGTITFATSGCTVTVAGNVATLTYANMTTAPCSVTASIVEAGITYSATSIVSKVVDGAVGTNGNSARRGYTDVTGNSLATTPTSVTTSGSTSFPGTGTWGETVAWTSLQPVIVAGHALFQIDGIYSPTTGNTVWGVPYLSALKVGQLSAITVDAGSITAGDFYGTTMHGGAGYPTAAYAWPAGSVNGGFHLSASGLLVGNANSGKYFQLDSAGNLYSAQFSIVNGNATFSGALSAATGTFGLIRTASSGQRTEFDGNGVRVYDSSGVMRVRLGVW